MSKKASESVEVAVEKWILSGDWEKGRRLPSEGALCSEFSVSRTAVREALRELRGKGLLETVNGSGSYVAGGNLQNLSKALSSYSVLATGVKAVKDLMGLRSAIEAEAAAALAENHADKGYQRLLDLHAKMQGEEDSKRFSQMDIKFHMILMNSAGNDLFALLGDALKDRFQRYVKDAYTSDVELRRVTLVEHQRIVDAITSGDVTSSRRAVRDHVLKGWSRWQEKTS